MGGWEIQHCHLVWKHNFHCIYLFFYLSQADAIYNMVGYPDFIMNATNLDKVFNDVGKCGTALYLPSILPFHTPALVSFKTLNWSLSRFSLRWCPSFTSKMSCSTTTSQREWLRTSWGKFHTETSKFAPLSPPPRSPEREAARSDGDAVPLSWLGRILLPSTNVPRQPASLRWTASLSLIMLVVGAYQSLHAFQTDL